MTGITPQAPGCGATAARRPAEMAARPQEARQAPTRFPDWTRPDADNRPRFVAAGDDGPKTQKFEERRCVYRQGDVPVRIKIIRGEGKEPLDVYRVVSDEGKTGWQSRSPVGFRAVPYFLHGTSPFDAEGAIYWTGDEQDADTIARAGLPAFTFGGVRDGLPSGCEAFVSGRDVVIVASDDKAGREHAEKKAALAARVAKSVRVVNFSDTIDVVKRLPRQSLSELLERVATIAPWKPPVVESVDASLASAQTEERLQLPAVPNRVPLVVEADYSEEGPMWPNVLVPYDEREAISVQVAARKAGKSPRTIRLWADEHGIGRRIAGGSWKISRVALQMLLDGDRAALGLYHAGNRRHPSVVAYFERVRRGESG
jgi:hypothetical protein